MATIAHPRLGTTILRPATKRRSGLGGWLTTVDHKRIGILYGVTTIAFFLLAGLEALVIRIQLIRPENDLVGQQRYNELFTMHGTTMIFLVVMPMGLAFFGNFLVPLQIGARDVAFPRLNAFSYWAYLAGGLILNLSWLANAVPSTGWYGYAPLTSKFFSPGANVDYWALGLQVGSVASIAGALNLIVTIVNMRAPGMTMMRLPIFTWAILVTSVLVVLAFQALTVGLLLLSFDRYAGTAFYAAFNVSPQGDIINAAGGDPLLWQHLFWVFGHPEVYIMILPAFGIVSEVIPVFSRKPLFGYAVMVYALAAIAFLGFGVWVHHMFTTGLGATAATAFAASSMLIAIPTGTKILNWVATMWGGSLTFATPMLFALGLVSQFVVGGLSGVMHAVPPVDTQQHDTYFVVAHFHYVLFGGAAFGLFAGMYYWWPKITGRLLDERLGKWHFWVQFVGFNLAFFPMHFLGLQGMPRRYASYGRESGWWLWNAVSSAGSFLIAAAVLVFLVNVARTLARGERAGANPWDAATPEWMIPSPPPVYNFRRIPVISHRDPLWIETYGAEAHADEQALDVTIAGITLAKGEVPDEAPAEQAQTRVEADDEFAIHLPNPSWYPLLASVGLFFAAYGLLVANPTIPIGAFDLPSLSAAGLLLLVVSIYGWSFEPAGSGA